MSLRHPAEPLPIIALRNRWETNAPTKYVMLHLDYGIIMPYSRKDPPDFWYYLFSRHERKIIKTQDFGVFMREVKRIKNGSTIDFVGKCTSGFLTTVLMSDPSFVDLLKRKKCTVVSSMEGDKRHASFCYCERDYTILEKVPSEQPPPCDVINAAP